MSDLIIENVSMRFDLPNGTIHRAAGDSPLEVPEGAVVVPGARPARGAFAREHGLHVQTPVIVKYRDASTDAATALEESGCSLRTALMSLVRENADALDPVLPEQANLTAQVDASPVARALLGRWLGDWLAGI